MKKLPEITLSDWLDAEKSLYEPTPQPGGSISVEQYAELRNLSYCRAGTILRELLKAGKARREEWHNGHKTWVYWLNK